MAKGLMGAGTHYQQKSDESIGGLTDELRQCYTPERTKTWSPINHGDFVDLIDSAVFHQGYELHETEAIVDHGHYTVINEDNSKDVIPVPEGRLFGTAELVPHDPSWAYKLKESGYKPMLGFRGSNDKSVSNMVMLGNQVFICSNLCWSAEIFETRKHVGDIMNAVGRMVDKAFETLHDKVVTQHERIENYHQKLFTNADYHRLVEDVIYNRKALPNNKYSKALDNWYEPEFEQFKPRTLYSAWNALTSTQGISRESRSPVATSHAMKIQAACDAYVA